MKRKTVRWRSWLCSAAAALVLTSAVPETGQARGTEEKAPMMYVKISAKNRADLDKLLTDGLDLTEYTRSLKGGGVDADAIVTESQMKMLQLKGYSVKLINTQQEMYNVQMERQFSVEQEKELTGAKDQLKILRANYLETGKEKFVYIEAKTSAGALASTVLTASWDLGKGTPSTSGGQAAMERLRDSGVYLYHSLLLPVKKRPSKASIASTLGGRAEANVTDWIGKKKPRPNKHYVEDFTDHYMAPLELEQRITKLARQFSSIAEIVELPNRTNGYRRKAQAVLGTFVNPERMIFLTSNKWGDEGGNDLAVQAVKQKNENQPAEVTEEDGLITVKLAVNASGEPVSTVREVLNLINHQKTLEVSAASAVKGEQSEIVEPSDWVRFTDSLKAPPTVSRKPHTMKAIRIGKHRDGSKTGVLLYSQEHAREWVTPLVTIETAERLLRNYATDKETKKLVDNLDIFIVPTMNPDGAAYSFYDFNWQRKNMTNYCKAEDSDPSSANGWGVDLNRNHGIGSVYDGYSGASTDCRSSVYAGPQETSEPEARNLMWLADENPHISFAMNVHSYGGYFMWPPGAYKAAGRETLPRPSAGQEAFFWTASEKILQRIKAYRGTTILPGRTGPVPDVLYSASGNSADALWYNHGIYAWDFEVGADLWDKKKKEWKEVGFQPPFREGHEEAMEFANGLIGMLNVAHDYQRDKAAPASKLKAVRKGKQTAITFITSEPATIYYTLDGKRPTFSSFKLKSGGVREGAETILLKRTTSVKWFAVDANGNVENDYDPKGKKDNYHSEKVIVHK